MSTDMSSQTVGGLMAYCDWLKDKGYQGASATDSWKSAAKMVFETVEPDNYESISLDGLDVDDYMSRFQTLAGSKLRAETVTVYGRRIRLAMDAHAYYLEHGKPPSFKRGTPRTEANGSAAKPRPAGKRSRTSESPGQSGGKLVEFPFPLRDGQMAKLHLPSYGLHPKDADRMSAFLRALQFEEQRQLPERTGVDDEEIAA